MSKSSKITPKTLDPRLLREIEGHFEAERPTAEDALEQFYLLETATDAIEEVRRLHLGIVVLREGAALAGEVAAQVFKGSRELLASLEPYLPPGIFRLWQARLHGAFAPHAAVAGKHVDAYLGAILADEPSSQQVTCALRLAHGKRADDLVEALAKLNPDDPRTAYQRIHVKRLRGLHHAALGYLHGLDREANPQDLSFVLAWERACLEQLRYHDLESLQQAVQKRGALYHPEYQTAVYLLTLATRERAGIHRLQAPRNVQRSSKVIVESRDAHYPFLKLAQKIDALSDAKISSEERLRQVGVIMAQLESLRSLEHELLCLVALAGTLCRENCQAAAGLAYDRYVSLSRAVSDGLSSDVLHSAEWLAMTLAATVEAGLDPQTKAVGRRASEGVLKRYMRVTKTSAQVASMVMRSRMRQLTASREHAERIRAETMELVAETITDSFSEMRGALGKVVQLTTALQTDLPFSLRDKMKNIYYDAPREDLEQVRQIFLADFGKPPEELFRSFRGEAFAAGSIAQVHRAVTHDGKDVAVKVRYRNIEKFVKADFRAMAKLKFIFRPLYPNQDVDGIMKTWENNMMAECNFARECHNLSEAAAILAPLAGEIGVPMLYEALCSENVITMDFVDGDNFDNFVDASSQEERDRAGHQIILATLKLLAHDRLKFDFHPGNYVFQDGRLFLLDFGAQEQDTRAGLSFLSFIEAVRRGDRAFFRRFLIEGGWVLDEGRCDLDKSFDVHVNLYLKPFLCDRFTFDTHFAREVFLCQTRKDPNLDVMVIPSNRITIFRIYWTLYSLLGELGATVRMSEVLEQALARPAAGLSPAG